jgi:serine/threonine protein kinase
MKVVIGDFGLCELVYDKNDVFPGEIGTPYFYSPEIWF